jgi:LysR family nitrogen assimilation transcriptional regulator
MSVENALASAGRKIRVAYEIESIPAVIDLVRQGRGFGVLPMSAVKAARRAHAVRVKPIVAPVLKASLSVATSAERPKSRLMRRAIELVRDVVRREIHAPAPEFAGDAEIV